MAKFFSFLLTLTALPIFAFSLKIVSNNANFHPEIALFGDAEIAAGGAHVQLTRPSSSSSGLLRCSRPFKFFEGNARTAASFSAEFSFSISPENGDGIALVFAPEGFGSEPGSKPFGISSENRFLGVEFDTRLDPNVGDLNANHVGIDVGSFESVTAKDVSSINLVLNSGEKLKSWVDYDASSKSLEVRLSKFGDERPHIPLLAHQIDFPSTWKDEDVFVGISSSNGNSSQTSNVYSWRFRLRKVPSWMHSLPADPHGHGEKHVEHKKGFCFLRFLEGLIFATGCGALIAYVMLFLWAIFVSRRTVLSVQLPGRSEEFRYQKVDVVAHKDDGNV